MAASFIDTNVIIRFLVETPDGVQKKFRGVFSFFDKVETGEVKVELTELVLFESFFVLTRIYKIPVGDVSEALSTLILFKGINLPSKKTLLSCLQIIREKRIDLVDGYLIACSKEKGIKGIYTFDKDLTKTGLKLLEVK
ncbi:MAG: type II toxin-antitoxin system VapC family toxin [Proteobacteria bacterium]|nr:type II toxin-antitoxin system VapC family toxin [Pseudomonadota bacterium]